MALTGSVVTRGYGDSNVKLVMRGFGTGDPYSHVIPVKVATSSAFRDGISKGSDFRDGVDKASGIVDGVTKGSDKA